LLLIVFGNQLYKHLKKTKMLRVKSLPTIKISSKVEYSKADGEPDG
jgi:hypothetical protein